MSGTQAPARISACVIAMNEADRIGPCLASLAFCDEIVVLDSGSTDGTQDICRAAGARVIETDWPGWVLQKGRAAEAAGNDWILSLDADERVDAELRRQIEGLRREGLDRPGAPRAYEMTRRVFYLGRWIRHGGWYPEWRTRLFHRGHAKWAGTDPHDRVESDAPPTRIRQGNLEHFTYRSMEDHFRQMIRFSGVQADEMYARGRRSSFWAMWLRPPYRFFHMYILRLGVLDGRAGFVLAKLGAHFVFMKYAGLWDRVRRGKAASDALPEKPKRDA